jgi:hypothetical protein
VKGMRKNLVGTVADKYLIELHPVIIGHRLLQALTVAGSGYRRRLSFSSACMAAIALGEGP